MKAPGAVTTSVTLLKLDFQRAQNNHRDPQDSQLLFQGVLWRNDPGLGTRVDCNPDESRCSMLEAVGYSETTLLHAR